MCRTYGAWFWFGSNPELPPWATVCRASGAGPRPIVTEAKSRIMETSRCVPGSRACIMSAEGAAHGSPARQGWERDTRSSKHRRCDTRRLHRRCLRDSRARRSLIAAPPRYERIAALRRGEGVTRPLTARRRGFDRLRRLTFRVQSFAHPPE